nr:hypothetical protein [Tanacetum cinerariifolium]
MCDKKNNVLFTDTECVILSPDFKLLDERQVLLSVPRKNNMYNVDLKNVAPSGGLTCLFANTSLDESNLWQRRLEHINFKTMNKLVRGNLVRGLPLKNFENNHTCVTCQKEKQHKASSTKDKTSGILKAFITGIENLIDHKVKIIRCDNGNEFKNKEMNQLYEKEGIKREFSFARTSQQNGVAKRKNRTLIETTRTMLADSKLPTTFWAEAVNNACYVQNRVLVIKPHKKTPYELFYGRTPSLSFMRPFGYPVTIINTLDPLGNQSNGSAGKAKVETVPDKYYILLPLWNQDLLLCSSSKDSPGDGFKPSREEEKKDVEDLGNEDSKVLSTEEPRVNQEKDVNVNSTNNINIVSQTDNATDTKDNVVDENIVYGCVDDLNMPNLEEIVYSDDDEDVGAEADMTNLDTNIPQVWTLVDLPNGKRAIGTKLIYKNKKNERGIVVRNKVRLVAQGYTQEEGTDYDEVFAPVARIESIRLILAYASFKDFVVYQMDVNSAFLYGKIKEDVYVCQPLRFEDPEFPDRVYKIEKALYGLHQAPRAWYKTLFTYLLDNGFHKTQIDKTLFIKRVKCDILLVQVYVDDIIFGSTGKEMCIEFEKMMHKKFQMSSMGELTFFLGLEVT